MPNLPDILLSLLSGILTSAVVTLADRKDREKAEELKQLHENLTNPKSRLTRTLQKVATAHCLRCMAKASLRRGHIRRAETFLKVSRQAFENTSYQQFSVLPILLSAELHTTRQSQLFREGKHDRAEWHKGRAIDELRAGEEVCARLGLLLTEIDLKLLEARLAISSRDWASAHALIEVVDGTIAATSYALREPDLRLLVSQVHFGQGHHKEAERQLAAAITICRRNTLRPLMKQARHLSKLRA